jgi:ESX secretion system ATPase EccB
MQSRRDHMHAYQFSTGRLVRAVAAGDSGTAEPPFRRSNLGVIAGTILAVLFGGGCVVYGLISPKAGSAWRAPGSIIVEKETGTRYLLLGGELRPTANYASALLAAGQKPSVQYVGEATLTGVPVGAPIGIAGAPDELPTASALAPGTWSLCLRPDGGAMLNLSPNTGAGRTLDGRRILIASTDPAQPAEYLVLDSVKYPLPQTAALTALGLGDQQPLPAAPAWLAELPTGRPVVAAAIPGAGAPGIPVGGIPARVGTLFTTDAGGARQYYVLRSDGLAPITGTEAALFAVAGVAAPTQVSPAAIAAAPVSADRSLLDRLPDLLSGPAFGGGALCVAQSSPGQPQQTRVVADPDPRTATEPAVVVPPRGGMLVQPPGGTQRSPAPEFLITDTGEKFLIVGGDALNALGYGSANPNIMPAALIDLIPSGPVLDVADAQRGTT